MSDKPDEQLVDLDAIVGDPPAGDAFLDDFVSNDQSADSARTAKSAQSADESEDES
jgi:hypothetical protein